jgi:hypothetical protein
MRLQLIEATTSRPDHNCPSIADFRFKISEETQESRNPKSQMQNPKLPHAVRLQPITPTWRRSGNTAACGLSEYGTTYYPGSLKCDTLLL